MRTWLALLVAPLLALTDQSIAYAAAGWACARQNVLTVHGVHAAFLVATVATTVIAWRLWRETLPGKETNETAARRHFLAGLAMASGLVSALAIAAMWIPSWLLSPCVN